MSWAQIWKNPIFFYQPRFFFSFASALEPCILLRFDGDLTGTLLIIKQRGSAELRFGVINHTVSKCRVCSFGIQRNIVTEIEGLASGESEEGGDWPFIGLTRAYGY